jgi:hypothetical protein
MSSAKPYARSVNDRAEPETSATLPGPAAGQAR